MCNAWFVRSCFVSVLGFLCLIALPTQADNSDWLQVERFKEVLSEAQAGKVQAMFEVGRKYERGRGIEQSPQKAAKWYERAAEANHLSAMARLGILYVEGNGVEQDLEKAVRLLTRAAGQNVPSAQYQLANMYELGVGVDRNLEQAIAWYRKAFKGGYYPADDKVKELTAQLNRRSAVANQPADNSATTATTLSALLEGRWQRNGRPAGYLPSSISQCHQQDETIKCISTAQERSTGSQTISYNTEATLSNFDDNRFEVTYINNVLEVEQEDDASAAAFEETDTSESVDAPHKQDRQNFSHHLKCTLETPAKPNQVNCTKDRLQTLRFTNG